MSHYTISSPNMITVHVFSKLKTSWKSVVLQIKFGRILDTLWAFLIKHYSTHAWWIWDSITANSVLYALLAIYCLISNAHLWNSNIILIFCDAMHYWLPHEMTSKERAQKFYTDDVSPPRLVVLLFGWSNFPRSLTYQEAWPT